MTSSNLSQEEIDALLKGPSGSDAPMEKPLAPVQTIRSSKSPAADTTQVTASVSRPTSIRPAVFEELNDEPMVDTPVAGMDVLLDVPLAISVELGRARCFVKDLVGLSSGSVVELDKAAGDTVDILVNGKLFARGEVVVIDENFGVRIQEIVNRK